MEGRRPAVLTGVGAAELTCPGCGEAYASAAAWRCPRCQSALELDPWSRVQDAPLTGSGLARYERWIPTPAPVSLGEAVTPLVALEWPRPSSRTVLCKTEGALPTGSFKDRGSAFLLGALRAAGLMGIALDSSGNAGASVAAYCARAGLRARIYVPASASGAKLAQIRAYGAEVVPVPGTRQQVGEAALAGASDELVYTSHVWSPYFIAGTQTFAFELHEQLGGSAPDAIVCPLGAGTLLLGCYHGFRALIEAGACDRMPALYGVQTARCAPLARMWSGEDGAAGDCAASLAEGILIAAPPRASSILAAVRETGGAILVVDEDAIAQATLELARRGVYAEPTAAVPAAALDQVLARHDADAQVVAAVTATGLKAGSAIAELLG